MDDLRHLHRACLALPYGWKPTPVLLTTVYCWSYLQASCNTEHALDRSTALSWPPCPGIWENWGRGTGVAGISTQVCKILQVQRACKLWTGNGSLVFTSSAAVYTVEDGSACSEDSPTAAIGSSERNDRSACKAGAASQGLCISASCLTSAMAFMHPR